MFGKGRISLGPEKKKSTMLGAEILPVILGRGEESMKKPRQASKDDGKKVAYFSWISILKPDQ